MLVEKPVSSDNGSGLAPSSDKPPQQIPVIGPGATAGPPVIYLPPIKAAETGITKPEVVLAVGSGAQQATSSAQTPSLLTTVTTTISRSKDSLLQFSRMGLDTIDSALLSLPRHLDQSHVDQLDQAVAKEMARGLPNDPTNAEIVKRGEALVQIFEADKEKYTDFYVTAVKLAVAAYHKSKVLDDLAEACKGVNSFEEIMINPVKAWAFDRAAQWIGVHADEARIMNRTDFVGIDLNHYVFDRLKMAIDITNKYTPVATVYLMALCNAYRHETGNVIEEQFVFSPELPEQIAKLWRGLGGIGIDLMNLNPINYLEEVSTEEKLLMPEVNDRITKNAQFYYYFGQAVMLIKGYYELAETI